MSKELRSTKGLNETQLMKLTKLELVAGILNSRETWVKERIEKIKCVRYANAFFKLVSDGKKYAIINKIGKAPSYEGTL